MLRRQGFTIVELVVSLSIISVLLSLLFPAIQAARQAARVTGCRNNLRQIGLALSNYHDVWQAVPVASLQFGNNGIVNGASYSWPVSLLPQLEQSSLYEKLWGLGTPGAGEIYWKLYQKPLPLIDSQLPVLRCPNTRLPTTVTNLGPMPPTMNSVGAALSDYGCCLAGMGFGLITRNWRPEQRTKFADVTDGLSNTIVFGEDSAPDQLGIEWPAWAISQSEYQAGFTTDHPIENPQAAGRYWMRVLFDASAVSSHTGFGVFCFADGSVRSIVTSVDAHVYLALGGIQDGYVVSLPD
ncbi:MAG: DUF1559 domain-containing protein [Planctomyces sp.]|jgi:prepilin-type N-terminal cleavage/methylation domain-containing protein